MTINGWPIGGELAYEMILYSLLPFLFIVSGAVIWIVHRIRLRKKTK